MASGADRHDPAGRPPPAASGLRGLWLARDLPFPEDNGDRAYSARLAHALAREGVELVFAGIAIADPEPPPDDWGIRWVSIPGERHPRLRALASPMPLVAAIHATPAYRAALRAFARERWDFVVIDQYGMGWATRYFPAGPASPVVVHVSKDHGATVTRDLYRGVDRSFAMRAGLWQNHVKTRRFERRLIERADLVTVVSAEDADAFDTPPGRRPPLVLVPGYEGPVVECRTIDAATPRRVVMLGSFHWVAKQHNLRQFVRLAAPAFAAHDLELHVIGSMPAGLATEIGRSARNVRLHGFVRDLAPHFADARIAIVPEAIGGGFKLKVLDYLFHRVPVAALDGAVAGLPAALRDGLILCPDLATLVARIVAACDRVDELDARQQRAFDAARGCFDWAERGRRLVVAIADCVEARRAKRPSPSRVQVVDGS